MIEAGEPSTGPFRDRDIGSARPTGDSYGRTTRGPAQRFKDAMRRPRCRMGPASAARGIIEAETRVAEGGLRASGRGIARKDRRMEDGGTAAVLYERIVRRVGRLHTPTRECRYPHIHPVPQDVVLARMRRAGGIGLTRPDGRKLCRILHVNFREFLFHELG